MALPRDAKLEKVLPGGIAIYDVSHILPQPKRPRYNRRPVGTHIVRIFFHHSGAYGRDGYDGAEASVNYVINSRDFGARPYHFWLAYKPDVDENGNLVVYRLGKNEERCWHTGKRANDEGIGVVWQGNLYPDETGKPSDEQYKMANALTAWLVDELLLELPDGLSFHAEADKWGGSRKSSCPGPYVQEWVEKRRDQDLEEWVQITDPSLTPSKPKPNKPDLDKVEDPSSNSDKKDEKGWFGKAVDTWLNNLFPGRKK